MVDDLWFFWLLWIATLVSIAYTIVHSYFTERNIYGAPLLLGLMFGYFYVFQTYVVATNLDYMLDPWMFELGQGLALVCFLALILGWQLALAKGGNRVISIDDQPAFNYRRMWSIGVTTVLIAIGALQSVDFTDDTFDYDRASAYWYMLYHIGYPGILACVIAMIKVKAYQTTARKLILLILALGLTYVFFLTARRGPTFPIVIMVIYGFGLLQEAKPKKLILLTSILGIGAAMLVFPLVRNYSEGGMNAWDTQSVETLSIESVTFGKAKQDGDNEALYHMGTVATAVKLENYQYGTGYLTFFTHWIPRSIWPDKPNLGQGRYAWTPALMQSFLGWELSSGAAAGGVAETFMELGFLAPLVWLAFGFLMGHLFNRGSSFAQRAQFITMLAASHWLVSQGVAAAYTPMLIYVFTITVIFKICKRTRKPYFNSTAPTTNSSLASLRD